MGVLMAEQYGLSARPAGGWAGGRAMGRATLACGISLCVWGGGDEQGRARADTFGLWRVGLPLIFSPKYVPRCLVALGPQIADLRVRADTGGHVQESAQRGLVEIRCQGAV